MFTETSAVAFRQNCRGSITASNGKPNDFAELIDILAIEAELVEPQPFGR
jgi:hypothetical protein